MRRCLDCGRLLPTDEYYVCDECYEAALDEFDEDYDDYPEDFLEYDEWYP